MILQRTKTIDFDPSNKAHRTAVRAFMKRNAWADAGIRFTHDPEYGSVADQVRAKLLKWYMAQEEKKSTPKAVKAEGSKELAFAMMGIASELPRLKRVS